MKRRTGPRDPDEELARLIRGSRVLDPALKQHWLRVFRFLSPADRARLEEILRSETTADVTLISRTGPSEPRAEP